MPDGCAVGCEVEVDGELYGRTADHGRFCSSCFARILYRLDEAPGIVFVLRSQMIPLGAQRLEGRITGTHDAPLPFREDALESADEVYATLANWCMSHAGSMGVRPPTLLLALSDAGRDSTGIPAHFTPQEASQQTDRLVQWLRLWAENIATLPGDDTPNPWIPAKAYHDSIVDLIRTMRNRVGLSAPRPRRMPPMQGWRCRFCLHDTAEVTVPDVGPIVARCVDCHAVTPIPTLESLAVAS